MSNVKEQLENSMIEHVRSIVTKHKKFDEKTPALVKAEVEEYLKETADFMVFDYIPVVKSEYDGMFLTLNFYTKDNDRLETFGDLIYYMDTGNK